ncbi:hypothetical protein EDD80_102212 [Anseongella ginsenosidimutans]|uniref:Fimbrillin-A associated anchor protein Mfa1/Mfa2 n=1 Tax=Anseongella ginsenosidimutans TaxID=496056 RepID=A0A4R3KVA4_9SPHI|nr:hypothetical protein [Anseongella ginsenosidimutans]QEC51671.1 hypothetical protein FRZ59_04490 [Anseongella ginsenosidimutans]TCS89021.1 hypothetical protein EDD80_102212 [Anseongella ginsenosidimutans]
MKKLLPILILILLSACQKEEVTKPEKNGELHAVTFELSGFTQRTEPISGELMSDKIRTKSTDDPDGPGSRYDYDECFWRAIKYYAYNEETGDLVRSQTSIYGSEDYGSFTDSLSAGNYNIVFVMCRGELTDYDWGLDWVQEGPAIYYSSKFNEATLTGYAAGVGGADLSVIGGFPDIFFKHIKLEVSGDVVMKDITLPRVVGGIEVRLTDDSFPDDLTQITTKQHAGYNDFPFNWEGASDPRIVHHSDWQPDPGNPLFHHVIVNPKTGKLTTDVHITAYRAGGELDTIAHKVIHDVEIEVNKKTILTGKLFDDPSQAFTVEVDTAWIGENELEF